MGWLEPFSHKRFSFNILYVADPFFSFWPGITALLMVVLKNDHRHRVRLVRWGLLFTGCYLAYCLFNKYQIDRDARMAFRKQGVSYDRYFTTPTQLNNWLWYIVAGNDSGFYIGYRSVFDTREQIDLNYFPQNKRLLHPLERHEDLLKLIRFSRGYYTIEQWHDTLVFNDLRFGQQLGSAPVPGRFAFYYFLNRPDANLLVVQRGRFAGWNRATVGAFIHRIKGD